MPGRGTPCNLLTFYSPFVPTLGANYGGTASFDLRSSVNPAYAAEFLLLLAGPPDYLDGLISENDGNDYHHLSIPLSETATSPGRRIGRSAPMPGAPALRRARRSSRA